MPITGRSYVVRREGHYGTSYLIGGPFDPQSIRAWLAWGGRDMAYVFPSKSAAVKAVRSAGIAFDRTMTVESANA